MDTLAPSHLSTAVRGPGLVTAEAESSLMATKYFLDPIACEACLVLKHCPFLHQT